MSITPVLLSRLVEGFMKGAERSEKKLTATGVIGGSKNGSAVPLMNFADAVRRVLEGLRVGAPVYFREWAAEPPELGGKSRDDIFYWTDARPEGVLIQVEIG